MAKVLEVSTATPTREAALLLAESAIRAGLAAGGQGLWPGRLVLLAHGEFGQGEEWKVSFKTTEARYPDLEAHLIEHHEWSNPEVTAVALARASAEYVAWVERVTAQEVAHGAEVAVRGEAACDGAEPLTRPHGGDVTHDLQARADGRGRLLDFAGVDVRVRQPGRVERLVPAWASL